MKTKNLIHYFLMFSLIGLFSLVCQLIAIPSVAKSEEAWKTVILPSGEVAHIGDPDTVTQEKIAPSAAHKANMTFILDASGSMNAILMGTGKSKLVVAKEVMLKVIPQIPTEVNAALWIYGHRYPQEPKEKSCQDIEKIFSLGPIDPATYMQKINAITAIGYTPIARSIDLAAQELSAGQFNSIILVSDGEETCGGDPCNLAETLKNSEAELTIHVVGYALKEKEKEQLQCIARVSGGTYHDAEDATGLLEALEEAVSASIANTILRVEIVSPDGNQEHANVYLNESGTDHRMSTHVAWKDNAITPGSYDLLVDTLPWTLYQGLTIEEGSMTIVRISLGSVKVFKPDKAETSVDIYDAAVDKRLGYYGGTILVVPGSYKLGINNSISEAIAVDASSANELVLGAIRPLTPEGKETSVDVYDAAGRRLGYYGGTILVLPGSFKLGVHNSISEAINIDTGNVKEVLLGAIQVNGSFTIYDASGKRLGYYGDTLLLVPGTYKVEMSDGTTFDEVTVNAGETTTVN